MMMRTFQASSLREAMKLVKDELGPNAVILVTREVKGTHLGQPTIFEVTAAADSADPLAMLRPAPSAGNASLLSYGPVPAPEPRPAAPVLPAPSHADRFERPDRPDRPDPRTPRPGQRPRAEPAPTAAPASPAVVDRLEPATAYPGSDVEPSVAPDVAGNGELTRALVHQIEALQRELQALRGARSQWERTESTMDELRGEVGLLARKLEQAPSVAAELSADPLVAGLIDAGVDAQVALGVVARAQERLKERSFGSAPPRHEIDLRGEIVRAMPTATALWSRRDRVVAAFIGPTGVGKTTTLAKIAAAAALLHKRRVALIAADTYRIAGIEQVRTYANLIGLPVRQARDRRELGQALVSFREVDLVLIDTTGRNPWSDEAIGQVSGMFDETRIEKHLCVSATTRPADLADIVQRYQVAGLTSLIVTKLDEARGPGAVLTATWASRHPVSHLCTGQQVPEDIEAASEERIAAQIMERVEARRRAASGG